MITFSRLGNHGRLGNQMFQYALLKSISLKNNFMMAIPKQHHQLAECFEITSKAYDLDNDKVRRVLQKMYKVQEPSFEFHSNILSVSDNTDLAGNFQTDKYFVDYREVILKEFTFKEHIRNKCEPILENLKSSKKQLVSLHIRRGDYVNLQQYHPLCDVEFYKKAMSHFDNVKFVCFSDDIEWCKEAFNFVDDMWFSNTDDPYMDLCLMSMCDHNIIANSSYSWWAAWLNTNKEKRIIAPKQWFGSKYSYHNTKDLLPEGWITV